MTPPPPVETVNLGSRQDENPSKQHPPRLLHNIKGLIFDFDGTLFDNALFAFYLVAANPLAIPRILRERHVRKRFAGCDYASAGEYYRAFFDALGKPPFPSPQIMRNWYFDYYMPRMVRVLRKHYKPRPGVQELLLRYGGKSADGAGALRIAVYSDYPFLKERMEALGIINIPGVRLYGPEAFGAQKPAARPFVRIAADFGARPEETLVIGDRNDTDGMGAFNAGMRYFSLETGRQRYYPLDPFRRPPKEEPHGPMLVMYAGVWDDLITLLMG